MYLWKGVTEALLRFTNADTVLDFTESQDGLTWPWAAQASWKQTFGISKRVVDVAYHSSDFDLPSEEAKCWTQKAVFVVLYFHFLISRPNGQGSLQIILASLCFLYRTLPVTAQIHAGFRNHKNSSEAIDQRWKER